MEEFCFLLEKDKATFRPSMLLGKKCKILVHPNYIIEGVIYSVDRFFNLLIYNFSTIPVNRNSLARKNSFLKYIRGEFILFIKLMD